MNLTCLFIIIILISIISCSYNPIPIGAVIVSTVSRIFYLQPLEYGGSNTLNTIYTAPAGMNIIYTIFDPVARNLYLLYTNSTNGTVYISQLAALEQLDSTVYELPMTFDRKNLNNLNSFSSDIKNRRAFLTDNTGIVKLFSMSGLMSIDIQQPTSITNPIRSVAYTNVLNRLFIITDTTIDSCSSLDTNDLKCCQALPRLTSLSSIAFDQNFGDFFVYVLDKRTGIYQVVLNSTGCPTAVRPINTLGQYTNLQFVVNRGLYFASGSATNNNDNSFLIIGNGTQTPRSISVGFEIVALHISSPDAQAIGPIEETCFNGITYSDYRVAVVLAAIFGTIMGIFMCFNVLFCIDFFMTKQIIRNLKRQIPTNLLEDRWNKLVEEKYAKIALEQQRKKDDPPPRRVSFVGPRRTSSAGSRESSNIITDSLQVPNPIPKISEYIRRKSESQVNRRRSDEYRGSRRSRDESHGSRGYPLRNPFTTPQVHIEAVEEENEHQKGLRQNLSRRELLKSDEDFL